FPLVGAPLPANARVGLPDFTGTLPNRDPASANGNGLDFLPKNSLAQPYVQNWSLGFQYQLPREVLLEANYIGSKGTRLLDSYFSNWSNQPDSKFMALGDDLDTGFRTPWMQASSSPTESPNYLFPVLRTTLIVEILCRWALLITLDTTRADHLGCYTAQ